MSLDELEKQINDLPKISESEFRKFVPILTDPKSDPNDRKKWLNICLDPRNSVLVVDDKSGEVLHRVPPLIYTSRDLTGKDISGTVKTINVLFDAVPMRGKQYANESITPDLVLGSPPEEDIKLWEEILVRYELVKSDTVGDNITVDSLVDDEDSW